MCEGCFARMPSKEVMLPKGKMWAVHKFGVGVARACVFAIGFRVYIFPSCLPWMLILNFCLDTTLCTG
jgi:hypothetical protein